MTDDKKPENSEEYFIQTSDTIILPLLDTRVNYVYGKKFKPEDGGLPRASLDSGENDGLEVRIIFGDSCQEGSFRYTRVLPENLNMAKQSDITKDIKDIFAHNDFELRIKKERLTVNGRFGSSAEVDLIQNTLKNVDKYMDKI